LKLPDEDVRAIEAYFADPDFAELPTTSPTLEARKASDRSFARWVNQNVHAHKRSGYGIVTVAVKGTGEAPGDASSDQMDVLADLGERYSFDELRISHIQNVILPHVRLDDLPSVYDALRDAKLASANAGLITDMIACPGLDYCALATARSIPVAQDISERFASLERQNEIGELKLKISGCINACGHHHVGHIGILGVEKRGEELYQVTLGGSGDEQAAIGQIIGRGFAASEITDAVETIVNTYLGKRLSDDETFVETYRRVGPQPFKDALYPSVPEAA
ncbi:MAG: nitrite/sulfite reductase, partial [Pseudomonadota bacterium]